MPLSEFHQISTRGKPELSQAKIANCSSELSPFMPDQDLVELLWENGQVVMHGQSDRPKKSSFTNTLASHSSKFRERECRDAVIPKIGHFGESADPMTNKLAPFVPSAPIRMNAQDDEMVPWINYQMEDSLQNDYCSDFFSELSGVNIGSFSTHNNVVPADRSSGFGHIVRDSHNTEQGHVPKAVTGGLEPSTVRTSQLFQSPQQCQSSVLNTMSRASEFGISGSNSIHQGSSGKLHERSLQKCELGTSKPPNASNGMGLMNFSHFSRPIALVRSNLQTVDRLRSNEKAPTATSGNPLKSTVINSSGGLKSLSVIQNQSTSVPPKVECRGSTKPPQEVIFIEQSGTDCRDDTSGNKHISNITNSSTRPPDHVNCQNSTAAAGVPLLRHEVEKGPEAVVASSSVCSANGVGADSNDPKHLAKRKIREGEESGYQSEDLEDESIGIKKTANVRSTDAKRSRAAEVHNLSERKRRDRINEKMRALQELIPNCNKVDKASMLDEAIEYLKTLQLQVQIMSMGSGLCMPPMMLPTGMQHLQPHPMAYFSPMGMNMGMGIGFGYGMGMIDVNGSAGCPMVPITPTHPPQFPCPSMPGAPNFHAMPGSTSLQRFGLPGQGHPDSMSHPQAFAGTSQKVNQAPEILKATSSPLLVADVAPSENAENQEQQNMKLETKTSARNSQIQTSAQADKEFLEQSALMHMSNQALHVNRN